MEPNQAQVLSIDVLEAVAAALVRCKEELAGALQEADSEIERALVWIEHDRVPYWRGRVQRLDHAVKEAGSAVFRKENHRASADSKPSTSDERRNLARAQAALQDAERRAQASQRWRRELPREHGEYRRGVNPLAAMVDRDLPEAVAALRRMIIALERYRRDQPIDLRALLPQAPDGGGASSTRRQGGDSTGGSA